jgi:2-keto-4-pentenoate hydratase
VDASNSEHALAVEVIDAWQFHAPVTLVETIADNPTKGGVI